MIYLGLDIGGTKIRGNRVETIFKGDELVDATIAENVFDEPELKTRNLSSKELDKIIYKAISGFGNPDEVVISTSIAGVINKKTLEASTANISYPINFPRFLRDRGFRSFVFNDLEAAGTALTRLGIGKRYERVAVLNAGTGNNIAFAVNGVIITEGVEAGHQFLTDGGIFCGCGGYGHLECYASGSGAATSAMTYFKNRPQERKHLILEEALKDWNLENGKNYKIEKLDNDDFWREIVFSIQGKHVMKAYERDRQLAKEQSREIGNPQKEIRRIQRNAIAYQLGQLTGTYRPELIIIRGSFVTESWADLGKPAVIRFLDNYSKFTHSAIERPKIVKKQLKKDGVIGAVLCAIDEMKAAA